MHNELMNQYNEIPKEIQDYSEEELLSLEKQDSKYEATLSILENNLQSLLDKEVSIRDEKDKLQIQLNSLFDQELLESTKNKINDLKIKLKFYEDCFESCSLRQSDYLRTGCTAVRSASKFAPGWIWSPGGTGGLCPRSSGCKFEGVSERSRLFFCSGSAADAA